MQAYMKSAMPYLGIPAVPFRKATKGVLAAYPLDSFEDWRDTALALWRGARYREERYAVIELVGYRSYEKFRTLNALPLYEEMITTGAWWDYVGFHRRPPLGRPSAVISEGAAGDIARMGRVRRFVETPQRDPGAAQVQGRYGFETPVRLHAAFARAAGVFSTQGHRMGLETACLDGFEGSGSLCEGARQAAQSLE
jgi:hypothetical protein